MPKPPRTTWPVLGVAALAFGVYVNSLGSGYAFDDYLILVRNPHARAWPGIGAFVSRDYFTVANELSYRPLVTLSYYFDFCILNGGRAQGRPFVHHLVNSLLHAANAALVLLLLLRLGAKATVAFMAAAVFAVHPVATEAVDAIAFREDLMALLFTLLALLTRAAALRARGWPRVLGFVAMALCAAAGALSKETALLLPLMALLLDFASRAPRPSRTAKWGSVLGLAVVSAAALVVRFGSMRSGLEGTVAVWGGSRWSAFLGTCRVMAEYGRLMLFPFGLTHEWRPTPGHELPWTAAAGGVAFVLGAAGTGLYWAWRWRPGAFAVGWAALWLLPVSNMAPIANPMAERYLYGALIGFGLVLAVALRTPALPRRTRDAVCLLVLVCFAALTIGRNAAWRSDRTLSRCAPSGWRSTPGPALAMRAPRRRRLPPVRARQA